MVQVFVGANVDLSDKPHSAAYQLENPIPIASQLKDTFRYMHYCYDPSLAPEDKSTIVINFFSDYKYWEDLYKDKKVYNKEKKKIADAVIEKLESYFAGIKEQVEVVEVATPMTFKRYTNNWQGTYQGWKVTKDTLKFAFKKPMKNTLPGLENFYMAGQWVKPGGGIPTSAISGKEVIQQICIKNGSEFTVVNE